jgi:hypothetical protein
MTATLTARLGLSKPDVNDVYNVGVPNANADLLDNQVGFLAATSLTRPSAPYNGQSIRETDTGKYYVSNGSAPASGSWTQIYAAGADITHIGNFTLSGTGSNLTVAGSASIARGLTSTTDGSLAAATLGSSADGTATLGVLVVNPFSANKRAIDVRLAGDSVSRFRVEFASGSGMVTFGDGTNADTNLYRGAANVLATDDAVNVGGTMGLLGATGALIGLANLSVAPTGTPAGVVMYASGGGLFARDGSGYVGALIESPSTGGAPTGAIAETVPRWSLSSTASPASGNLYLTGVWLQVGQKVTSITFMSGTTAAISPTHWWFALVDKNFKLQGHTADQTTTAWAATTAKTVALVTPYTATYTGMYYLGFMMTASTLVNVSAAPAALNQAALAPPFAGPSSSGLTTPGTDNSTTYTSITGNTAFTPFYANVS